MAPDDISQINQKYSKIEIDFLKGGKDTIFLIKMKVENYKFIYKLYNLKSYEIFTYLLSIREFNEKIPDKIYLEEQGFSAYVHIVPLHVYAVGKITSQKKSSYVVIQEYSEELDYTEFVKTHNIPFNIVKRAWKYIHKNGFVIDFLPSNFKISFNKEHGLYWLEYIDYLFFNDPNLRSYASVVEEELSNELVNHEYFSILERK